MGGLTRGLRLGVLSLLLVILVGSAMPVRGAAEPVWRWPLVGIDQMPSADRWSERFATATQPQVRFWREHALDAWFSEAFDAVAGQGKDPPRASRAYAYLAVGAYDAIVAAARVRRTGSDTSTTASIAGAASTILPAMFPELPPAHFAMLVDQAASAEVAAGWASPAVRAGVGIGRAVGELLLVRARSDGYARTWDGAPTGPWEPPPDASGPLIEPMAGAWRTWLLPSGDAFRPGPPPSVDSAELRTEALEVLRRSGELTARQRNAVLFWSAGQGTPSPAGEWNQIALYEIRRNRLPLAEAARVLAALNMALADAGVAAWDAKYTYWQPRPVSLIQDLGLAPDWRPLLDTPVFPSYVSGHSTYSAAAAEVLAAAFPNDADLFRAKAQEAAVSRIDGGIHFRSDVQAGFRMGLRIGHLGERWLLR